MIENIHIIKDGLINAFYKFLYIIFKWISNCFNNFLLCELLVEKFNNKYDITKKQIIPKLNMCNSNISNLCHNDLSNIILKKDSSKIHDRYLLNLNQNNNVLKDSKEQIFSATPQNLNKKEEIITPNNHIKSEFLKIMKKKSFQNNVNTYKSRKKRKSWFKLFLYYICHLFMSKKKKKIYEKITMDEKNINEKIDINMYFNLLKKVDSIWEKFQILDQLIDD